MAGASNVVFTCALYRTAVGLEVRAGHGEQDALLRKRVASETAAALLASTWKKAAEAKGFRDVALMS
jgi:hypothetical protein